MSPTVDMTVKGVTVLSFCKPLHTVRRHLDPDSNRERGLYTLSFSSISYKQFQRREMSPALDMTVAVERTQPPLNHTLDENRISSGI
jgi:hypothetical protein